MKERMLGKIRRVWAEERLGVWNGKEEGEQLNEIVGLVLDPAEVLARAVDDKGNGERRRRGVLICYYTCITQLMLVHSKL